MSSPVSSRTAVVHDWLVTWRGGENVLAEVLQVVPDADLYALVDFLPSAQRDRIGGRRARTSFIQNMPFARTRFRWMLPAFPAAIERLDLAGYGRIVSVSHAVAKNVRVAAGQVHFCYCLTPMRYAWDMREDYLASAAARRGPRRWLGERLLDRLQAWDRKASGRVAQFAAISHYVASRIDRAYDRQARVIYPPVDVDYFEPAPRPTRDYYLTGGQWVAYKRVDAIVEAFRSLGERRLVVTGDGPEARRVRAAAGPNVEFVGEVSRDRLRQLLQHARAFVFSAEEDFGILPVEAQACGTPVIALSRGGTAETIVTTGNSPTGVAFADQRPASIAEAIRRFEGLDPTIDATACRRNALRFAAQRFRAELCDWLALTGHRASAVEVA
jgi:glycosyltransferase involved in cell wall biosynthesis